jgi:hypothetical protein
LFETILVQIALPTLHVFETVGVFLHYVSVKAVVARTRPNKTAAKLEIPRAAFHAATAYSKLGNG